jgi:flagellin
LISPFIPMSSINSHHLRNLAAGLARLQPQLDAATARLSSGQRIDQPARDVAGVGMLGKLDAQQKRLNGAEVNLQNGVSRLQVTTQQITTMNRVVTRLAELATLRNNPLQSPETQGFYGEEATALQSQLRQMIGGTRSEVGGAADVGRPLGSFNGKALFGPDSAEVLAIGLNPDERVFLPLINQRQGAMGDLIRQDATGAFTFSISSPTAISQLDAALDQLGQSQAKIGAIQSRLDLASEVVTITRTNTEAALSGIRDADVAESTTALTRLQFLSESHTAMIAQARDANAKLLPLLSRR